MATISSVGIGSGLDVNSIVTQLVALEKQPLKLLAVKATNVQSQMSAFGQIQSQFAALTDVASRISVASNWGARTASSSNASVATIKAEPTASAAALRLDVDQLALQQSVSSAGVAPGATLGAGQLTLQLGTWAAGPDVFAAGTAAAVTVDVTATDTLATIASKINATGAGVVASVFNDGAQDRLLLRSSTTGAAAGFRLQSDDTALAGLVFDPQNKADLGMAASGNPVQHSQDAKARINGLAVTSATNTLTGNLTGITIDLLATTTVNYGLGNEVKAPITLSIREDVTPAVKNVNDFVEAYNKLNQTLADLTKYDASTKTAGLFQGDASVVGLRSVLSRMLGSSSMGASSQYLSEVGLERQLDGSLKINTAKLSTAANNGTTLQQLFTANNNNTLTDGFALKFKALGEGVAASGGALGSKTTALKRALDANTAAQTQVNERAVVVEARLRSRYSALDAQMAQLTALNSYIAQQVTTWNQSKS
jgi:flagellar hook-associated protein 2